MATWELPHRREDPVDYDPDFILSEADHIVIVLGSYFTRAGFAGEDAPRAVFPSLLGRSRHRGIMAGMAQYAKDCFVGTEAQAKCGVLHFENIVERSMILNEPALERLLHHTFYNELRICRYTGGDPFVVTIVVRPTMDPAMIVRACFDASAFCAAVTIQYRSAMSLVCRNPQILSPKTGISLHVGHGCTWVVPVVDGEVQLSSLEMQNLGGSDITELAMRLMLDHGHEFTTSAEREIVRDMKERRMCVCEDIDEALKAPREELSYEMPDGMTLQVVQPYLAPTALLFELDKAVCRRMLPRPPRQARHPLSDPEIFCLRQPKDKLRQATTFQSVTGLVLSCLKRCQQSLACHFRFAHLCSNVVLSGGSTLFPGFVERLKNELSDSLKGQTVHVVAVPERKHLTWLGASAWAIMKEGERGRRVTRESFEADSSIVSRLWDLKECGEDENARLTYVLGYYCEAPGRVAVKQSGAVIVVGYASLLIGCSAGIQACPPESQNDRGSSGHVTRTTRRGKEGD